MPFDAAVRVREATDADRTAIAALRRSWAEQERGPSGDGSFEDRLEQWLDRNPRLILLAERSAEHPGGPAAEHCDGPAADVIGMINLAFFERMPRPDVPDSRWAYLANAYVRPEHRNAGIGGALLDAAVAAARERGCVRVVLAPSERSRPFYRRADFGPATMLIARDLG